MSNNDELEDFLAAPDSLRQSEDETRKALSRKARQKAESLQLRRSKLKRKPSEEDLLADIIRVASDENVNPHHKFKVISRKRYRLYGHYPVDLVDERYGTFEHAKEVAGLSEQKGTRQLKSAKAEASRRGHAARYAERYILPHAVTNNYEASMELEGVKVVLSISDTHATFLDPFTWHAFLMTAADLKPDVVYLNGDILEGGEISRHPKIPGWSCPLQVEFDFAREMFRQIREVVPKDTKVVWGAGNHGLDRMASYLTQVAPALSGLRSMRFDKLAGLDDLDVKLAQGGTIASPEGTEDDGPGMLITSFYRIHHGTKLGQMPAMAELKAAARSGQSGHVHRPSLAFGTTEVDRSMCWMSTPMGCTEKAGRAYIKGVTTGWSKGFGLAFLGPGKVVRQYPVITDDGVCIVEGRVFREPRGLPKMDPTENWLERMPLP